MSNAEYDDSCAWCDGRCTFSMKMIKGHDRKHKVAHCTKCGRDDIVTDCKCKGNG